MLAVWPTAETRPLWALAALAAPASAALSLGIGMGLMAWAGCTHLSATWGAVGAGVATVLGGALTASLVSNVWRARRAVDLAEQASVELDDPERTAVIEKLAAGFGMRAPALRAVVHEAPLAFCVMGREPAIVVSTWVFDRLSDAEFEAVVAHELAHLRPGDRAVRWAGAWVREALKRTPGIHRAWQRLDDANEDAADRAAIALLGGDAALVAARRKFRAAQGAPDDALTQALAPWSAPRQWAIAALGLVASLPLVPFVVVPLCTAICAA